jgi:hypothetical protein
MKNANPVSPAKPARAKRIDRLHAQNPTDAAWRAQQARVDADIEGLRHDAAIEQFVDEIRVSGIAPRERIERLKAYVRARQIGRT